MKVRLEARRIRGMFDEIAGSYDLLNHLLSVNLDTRWRQKVVELADPRAGESVLDLCCGTGDLAFAFADAEPGLERVVGVDFSEKMLALARKKAGRYASGSVNDRCSCLQMQWLCADVTEAAGLLQAESFDCVSCAFGLRNVQDVAAALGRAYDLLKPGGRLIVLEFAMPKRVLLRYTYLCYFKILLPLIGSFVARDRAGAYHYLPRSVQGFGSGERLPGELERARFEMVSTTSLAGGIVVAFLARKQ